MTECIFPVLWCVAQVSILSAIVLAMVRLTLRDRPEVAARCATWAVGIVLVITLLIPVSMSRFLPAVSSGHRFAGTTSPDTDKSTVQIRGTAAFSANVSQSKSASGYVNAPAFYIDHEALFAKLSLWRKSPSRISLRCMSAAVIFMSIGISWGLLRLTAGLLMLYSLRRRAVAIKDSAFQLMAADMMSCSGTAARINFAESSEIDCGAVVGFIRPAIFVSDQWRTWTCDELRCVLAHELAHVHRMDAPWRLAATVCRVIHFYNPLIRSLVARLILAQELAADQLAVKNAGGPESYLRSISRLALRQDERAIRTSHTLIMPVFSGHWIRRIEMLRATDCRHNRSGRNGLLTSAAVTLMIIIGITTTVSRGLAEGDESAPESLIEVPSDSKRGSVEPNGEKVRLVSGTFDGERVSALHAAFDEHGAVFVNFGRLRETCGGPIVKMMLANFTSELGKLGEVCELDAMDALMTSQRLSLYGQKRLKPGEKGRLFMGLGDVISFRTNRPFEWNSLIHKHFPDSVDADRDGLKYTELHTGVRIPAVRDTTKGLVLPTLSVSPLELAVLLSFYQKEEPYNYEPLRRFLSPEESRIRYQWADEWNAVSGGVAAVSLALPTPVEESVFQGFEGADQANLVTQTVDTISCGIDIRKDSHVVEAIVRLRGRSTADPEKLLAAVQTLIELGKRESPEMTPAERSNAAGKLEREILNLATVKLIKGTVPVIECRIEYPLPPFLLAPPAAVGTQGPEAAKRSALNEDGKSGVQ